MFNQNCKICGFSSLIDDEQEHINTHSIYVSLEEAFGPLPHCEERETIRLFTKHNLFKNPADLESAISLMRVFFARSVLHNKSMDHPHFEDYCAMFLKANPFIFKRPLYTELASLYGTSNGLIQGSTVYDSPEGKTTEVIFITEADLNENEDYNLIKLAHRIIRYETFLLLDTPKEAVNHEIDLIARSLNRITDLSKLPDYIERALLFRFAVRYGSLSCDNCSNFAPCTVRYKNKTVLYDGDVTAFFCNEYRVDLTAYLTLRKYMDYLIENLGIQYSIDEEKMMKSLTAILDTFKILTEKTKT